MKHAFKLGGQRSFCKVLFLTVALIGFWFVGTVDAAPSIEFVDPTPSDGTNTTNTSIEINVSITESDLGEMKFNWNDVNYTFYDDNLVLMMNFDNVSALGENDTYVVDVSRYGNNGTIYGNTSWNSTGKYGGAFEFDGGGDYVNLSSAILNSTNQSFTISLWAKRTPLGSYEYLLQKQNVNNGFALLYRANKISLYVPYNSWEKCGSTGTYTEVETEFHHIVADYNGTSIKLYRDGSEIGSCDWSAGQYTPNSNSLYLGAESGSANFFNGTIDEVRIWNRSLTSNEVKQQYYGNLYKYDLDKWVFYINESDLNIASNTYFATASNSSGNENLTETRTIPLLFKTTQYYDNRKMAVVWTGDDYGSNIDKFINASNYARNKKVVFSPGIITSWTNETGWDTMQIEINEGFVFPVSHSVNHAGIPYDNTTLEVCTSKQYIIDNLTLPWQNWYNGSEYLVSWIEPGGGSDSAIRGNLSECNYLCDRSISTGVGVSSWASWNSSDGLYERYGASSQGEDDNLTTLNTNFDTVYSNEGIYHLYMHPGYVDQIWTEEAKIPQHLTHIGNRTDVWYVGWGQLYMYHYLEDRVTPTINLTTRNNQIITAKINTSGTERNKYGLSYPVTYAFAIPSVWSNVFVFYKNTFNEDYTLMTEKTSSDFFNGIDAYRTNLSENGVYVSKGFPQEYNEFYLKIVPSLLAPTLSFSCSPTSVTTGQTITCSCSATDASDSNPTISYTVNPSTSLTGTFTTTCTATDDTGNSASSSISYTVSSSGGGTPSSYTNTIVQDYEEFSEIGTITKELKKKERVRIKIDNKKHYIGVAELTETTATVEIFSTSQKTVFNIGDENKFDVTEDNYYDIYVKLNSIANNKANLTIKSIYEEIPECEPNWDCSEWSECVNNIRTRSCIDLNDCNVTEGRPDEVRECELKTHYIAIVIVSALIVAVVIVGFLIRKQIR